MVVGSAFSPSANIKLNEEFEPCSSTFIPAFVRSVPLCSIEEFVYAQVELLLASVGVSACYGWYQVELERGAFMVVMLLRR